MQNTNGTYSETSPAVADMTDREILVEILTILRQGVDAVEGLMSNPMVGAMLPGIGGGDPVAAALNARR